MGIEEVEQLVIECLQENLELSGEPVPKIDKNTKPACDLDGFDSLRAIEVVTDLEDKLKCELPPEKIFMGKSIEDVSVSSIASAIYKIQR